MTWRSGSSEFHTSIDNPRRLGSCLAHFVLRCLILAASDADVQICKIHQIHQVASRLRGEAESQDESLQGEVIDASGAKIAWARGTSLEAKLPKHSPLANGPMT